MTDFPWQDFAAACLVMGAVAYLAWRFLWPRTRARRSLSCPSCGACPAAPRQREMLDIDKSKKTPSCDPSEVA
jgi:hypothetical protein